MFANYAYAQTQAESVAIQFVQKLNEVFLYPIIVLLTVLALVIFLWGAFQFVAKAGDSAGRSEGAKHMLWGIVGLLVMLSAYAILSIFLNTFGVEPPENVGLGSNSPFAPQTAPLPVTRPEGGATRPDGSVPTSPLPGQQPVEDPLAQYEAELRQAFGDEELVRLSLTAVNVGDQQSRIDTINSYYANGYISEPTRDAVIDYIKSN